MRKDLLVCVAVGIGAGCWSGTTTPVASSTQSLIFDSAHGGPAGVYFLPPLVPAPALTGAFSSAFSPIVRIDQIDSTGQVLANIATFTTTTGPGSETVRSTGDPHWIVNWHTDQFNLVQSATYRINIVIGVKMAAFADVQVVANGSQIKNVDTQQFVALVDGRTLPIKFWTNACAPVVCAASDQCHDVGVCDPATAACSNPAKANGASCDDGNLCTQADSCQAGSCVGGGSSSCGTLAVTNFATFTVGGLSLPMTLATDRPDVTPGDRIQVSATITNAGYL